MCVALCSKQVLGWNGSSHPVKETRTKKIGYTSLSLDTCTFCEQFCAEACPRLFNWLPRQAEKAIAVRARGPVDSGEPNDVIRSIVAAGLSAGLLDGVLMLDLDPWNLQPVARIADSVEAIVSSVGVQYLWTPIFEALNEAVFERQMEKLAVVASPCAIQAIDQLRRSTKPELRPYQDAILLTVSVFCTGMYLPQLVEELIVREARISPEHVMRLEMSADMEWLQVFTWDGKVHRIPRQKAERYTRDGCASCVDYLGESADLAVGDLGSVSDRSTVLVRTRTGDVFLRNGVRLRLLETGGELSNAALESAASEKSQRQRAQAFKALHILMLDALADPAQRNKAIQQFTRLYRTPTRARSPQISREGCTGC
jgi:coenzyme F420 hydrogenase subunit beta